MRTKAVDSTRSPRTISDEQVEAIIVKTLEIAKLIEHDPADAAASQFTTAAVTELGTVLGTAGYMAPEQVRGEAIDHRADIFALGAIL